jgi:predicted nucleotidyltransferase
MSMHDVDNSLLLPALDDDWSLDYFLNANPPPRRWPVPADDAITEEMVSIIVRDFDPLAIILFGSRAWGDHRPLSDVDLLIALPRVHNKRDVAASIATSLCYMPLAKDIFVTTNEEIATERDQVGSLIGQALRDGKVLHDLQLHGMALTTRPRPGDASA